MFSWLSPLLKCNLEFTTECETANCITHNGRFHADETFCTIFMAKYLKKAIVYRSPQLFYSENQIHFPNNAIVYDIGYGELDHHQKYGNGLHNSSEEDEKLHRIPYASLGLCWRKYGKDFCEKIAKSYHNCALAEFLFDYVEKNLILAIDAADNGIYSRTQPEYYRYRILPISAVISLFNLTTNEYDEENMQSFYDAHSFASTIFDMIIKKGILEFEKQSQANVHSTMNFEFKKIYAHEVFTHVIFKRIFPNSTLEELNLLLQHEETEILYHVPHSNSTDYTPIPTSTFGIVWEKYGKSYCKRLYEDEEKANFVWQNVLKEIVLAIDAYANGLRPLVPYGYVDYPIYTISEFMEDLNLLTYSEESYNQNYETAFRIAESILDRILLKALDIYQSRDYISEKISSSKGHILVLEKYAHWREWLFHSTLPQARNIWFVIFPNNGIYNTIAITSKYSANGYRKGFPQKWYGWNRYQKNAIQLVPTAISIHPQGMIASTETLEDAIALAEKAFANNESTTGKHNF